MENSPPVKLVWTALALVFVFGGVLTIAHFLPSPEKYESSASYSLSSLANTNEAVQDLSATSTATFTPAEPEENIEDDSLSPEPTPAPKLAPEPAPAPKQEPAPVPAPQPELVPPPAGGPKPAPILSLEEYPDLIIAGFSHYGARLEEGEALSFSVIVQNESKDKTAGASVVQLFFDRDNDGSRDLALTRLQVAELEPKKDPYKVHDKESHAWRNAVMLPVGTHRMEVCLDVDNEVEEANESNNCESLVFSVSPSGDNADLTIDRVTPAPKTPVVGDLVSFFAVVRNVGTGRSRYASVSLWVEGRTISRGEVSSINPGKTETVELSIWRGDDPGTYSWRVCADTTGRINEPDESNNCLEGEFEVLP